MLITKFPKNYKITCRKCMASSRVDGSNIKLVDTYESEKSMGIEVEYTYEHPDASVCTECDSSFTIRILAYEYPLGFSNYIDDISVGISKRSMKDLSPMFIGSEEIDRKSV
jgi:hypothetical protein